MQSPPDRVPEESRNFLVEVAAAFYLETLGSYQMAFLTELRRHHDAPPRNRRHGSSEKIAHVVEGKEGFALVLEQPDLSFDKFAPAAEAGLKQVSLKAVDRFAKNSGHQAAKRFGLIFP